MTKKDHLRLLNGSFSKQKGLEKQTLYISYTSMVWRRQKKGLGDKSVLCVKLQLRR